MVLHVLDEFVQEQICKTPFGPADPFSCLLYTWSGRFPEQRSCQNFKRKKGLNGLRGGTRHLCPEMHLTLILRTICRFHMTSCLTELFAF